MTAPASRAVAAITGNLLLTRVACLIRVLLLSLSVAAVLAVASQADEACPCRPHL